MTLEPNEVRVIHALFHAMLFRPALSTHILGIIQAVVRAVSRSLMRAPRRVAKPESIFRIEFLRIAGMQPPEH